MHSDHSKQAVFFVNSRRVALFLPILDTTQGHIPYFFICFVCFLMGFFGVLLRLLRSYMENRFISRCPRCLCGSQDPPLKSTKSLVLIQPTFNVLRALMVFLLCTWDNLLMLAIMTCNVGIFFSVILGISFGHLCFAQALSPCDDPCLAPDITMTP